MEIYLGTETQTKDFSKLLLEGAEDPKVLSEGDSFLAE